MPSMPRVLASGLGLGLLLALPLTAAWAAEDEMAMTPEEHAAMMPGEASGADPHAHHRMMMEASHEVHRSLADYAVPELKLVRDDGKSVSLSAELDDGRPVFMNFIYTTCTTICPLTSQVFGLFQQKLGDDSASVHLVSISIDPEQDTPARLTEYAKRFRAGRGWQHYTGTAAASVAAQRAFNVYRGDKMNHTPVTLVRPAPGSPWVRLDGFATADQLYAEYQALVAAK
jgi:protein SCO1/2